MQTPDDLYHAPLVPAVVTARLNGGCVPAVRLDVSVSQARADLPGTKPAVLCTVMWALLRCSILLHHVARRAQKTPPDTPLS